MPLPEESTYRPIGQVATLLRVQPHVLRFWETKFKQISPLKRSGGRRYYRREDVRLLFAIRDLLYVEGYTLRGAQKALRERVNNLEASISTPSSLAPAASSAPGSARNSAHSLSSNNDEEKVMSSTTRARLEETARQLEQALALCATDSSPDNYSASVSESVSASVSASVSESVSASVSESVATSASATHSSSEE